MECANLKSAREVFDQYTEVLLREEKPSKFFQNQLKKHKYPKDLKIAKLYDLSQIDQNKKYHPEGSVWNHVMMVVDQGAKRRGQVVDPKAFMWATLLHDMGKLTTTKVRKGRITAYDHDKVGAVMVEAILQELTDDIDFIQHVVAYVRWHMQPLFVKKGLSMKDMEGLKADIDPIQIARLSLCDRLGRGAMSKEVEVAEATTIDDFLKAALSPERNQDEISKIVEDVKSY